MLLVAFFSVLSSYAQLSNEERILAMGLVNAHSSELGMSIEDLQNFEISSTYFNPSTQLRMVYVQQTYKGIPVFNKMQVLAFKNNQLVSSAGSRIQLINQLVNNEGKPMVALDAAIISALQDQKIVVSNKISVTKQLGATYFVGNLGVAYNDISATLVWLPISEKSVRLTWQIEVAPLHSSDHLLIRVDAETNQVLDKNNYTVYEQFQPQADGLENARNIHTSNLTQTKTNTSPSVVSSASYKVVPFPAESPNHIGGTAALVTDPWTLAAGNATSLGWHYDGTSYRDSSRGNNVWSQEDRDNNNATYGKAAVSSTSQPTLTFNYSPDYTKAPTDTTNQKFAIANLFYWNNLMHDLLYVYGFDEVSGNFQTSNQSRGGLGNDYVVADAQDAGGTNNANFSTPVDGSLPRMQMYLFTYTTPNRDGDLDNGVITHEYGHGLSNRLTGGPANSSCLSNAEQGGEGWSDYIALMTTTNWATAAVTDGALAKPIGTYVLGQATTAAGIRTYPYSTNMSINPWTYAMMAGSGGEVHKIGEIWCTVLWDMTWEMIAMDGINTNIFNPSGTGGNSAALKLVIEGMRLQPCSPGYIDARNAILKADTLFFGGKYSCAIWKAFAKRGMGKNASQGSSNSTTDQVADFTDNGSLVVRLSQSTAQQTEGQNVTYNTFVSAGSCSGLSNYTLRDTLPSNVTYVSGGSYDSITRVVSFPVNIAVGGSLTYSFSVMIKTGSYYPDVQLINETVPSTTVSSNWTTSSTSTTNWVASAAQSVSAPNSFFSTNLTTASDQKIETTNPINITASTSLLTFQGYINSESGWDGGVVEISTNNGTTWTDLGSAIISGGYNGVLGTSTSGLSGRSAFTGNSNGFVKTTINLSNYIGQSVRIRFRFASDASVAATGWYVDDIQLSDVAQVKMRSSVFNATNARIAVSDTTTTILQAVGCISGSITTQPSNSLICANATTSNFTVVANGTSLLYQWQVSVDGGASFNDLQGANSNILNLTGLNSSNNNYQYRCVINGTCTNSLISNVATLGFVNLPNAPTTSNTARCSSGTVTLSGTAGANETIDWYSVSSGGTLLGSGVSITSPTISTTTTYYAAARNTQNGCTSSSRNALVASVLSAPAAPVATSGSRCGTGSVNISATPGTGETIDWYPAATAGTLLASSTNSYATPSITATTTYYAASKNAGCASTTRTSVSATINALPASITSVTASARCGADTATISATSATGCTVNWYADSTTSTVLQAGTLTGVNKYLTPVIAATTTYWVVNKNLTTACLSAARKSVIATINVVPAAPAVRDSFRCGSGAVKLTAILPTNPIGTVIWYAAASGGTSLGTASTYTTPTITATTSYYVEAKATTGGCLSKTRSLCKAIIYSVPGVPVAVNGSRCGTGTVSLSATPSAGLKIDWYSAATSGTLLLIGNTTYVTPSITATKSYYATARDAVSNCVSATRATVIATVTSVLAAPSTLTGTTSICSIVGTATSTPYTCAAVTGATSYSWTIPSGAVIDSGNNGTRIRVRFVTAGSNDSVYVQANNGCLGAKKVLKLVTTGCATTPFAKVNTGSSVVLSSHQLNGFELNTYPNPSQNFFNIQLNSLNQEKVQVKLFDLQGRVLQTAVISPNQKSRVGNNLKSGTYFIEVKQGEKMSVQKVIKL